MAETTHDIARGLMDDGEHPYVPRVNCSGCGRFVGRDGWIEISHREMSNEVASVEGQCARCISAEAARETAACRGIGCPGCWACELPETHPNFDTAEVHY